MNWQENDYRPSRRPLTHSDGVSEHVAYLDATINGMIATLRDLRDQLSHAEQFNRQTLEYRLRLEHQISNMAQRIHALAKNIQALESHKEDQIERTERWMTVAKWGGAAVLGLATLAGKMQAETVTKLLGALLK